MSKIIIQNIVYELSDYDDEKEIENALNQHANQIFGKNRIYLDFKKKIGQKNKTIPDGYLLDFSSSKPEIYFVEVELDTHHIIKHIATQILGFSIAFNEDKKKLADHLIEYIENNESIKELCLKYIQDNSFSNLHDLINKTVFESTFQSIIVINEADSNLEKILKDQFTFDNFLLTIKKYENSTGEKIFQYDSLSDESNVSPISESDNIVIDKLKCDTIVVPAREEGFNKVFIGEDRWYKIRIAKKMIPLIKYIAVYQVKPVFKITHVAEVKDIIPWEDSSKYVLNFIGPASKLEQPVVYYKDGKIKAIQHPRYAEYTKLISSKTFDELWG